MWGINSHNREYAAYPEKYYKEHVRLSAELGCKLYRFNYNPVNEEQLAYLDSVMAELKTYGMDMMLVIDDDSGTLEEIAARMKIVAGRYGKDSSHGFIKYIQTFNETNMFAMKETSGNQHFPHGTVPEEFSKAAIDNWYGRLDAAITAIREVNRDVEIVLNIAYKGYGYLKALEQRGLKWEAVGIDWYEHCGDFSGILDPVKEQFPGHEIIICETNIFSKESTVNAPLSRWQWLLDNMEPLYKDDRVKGVIFYELLDQPALVTGGNVFGDAETSEEANAGIIACSANGEIGKPKAVYGEIQRLIGGSNT